MAIFNDDEVQILAALTDYFHTMGQDRAAHDCVHLTDKLREHVRNQEWEDDRIRSEMFMKAELVKFRARHDPANREFHEGMFEGLLASARLIKDVELVHGLEAIWARKREIGVLIDCSELAPHERHG